MSEMKKFCPSCSEEMELAVKAYPMGSVFHLDRIHADVYRCPKCQRIQLFAAESDMVTCPVCGTVHPAQERCVTCALDAAFGGAAKQEELIPKK